MSTNINNVMYIMSPMKNIKPILMYVKANENTIINGNESNGNNNVNAISMKLS